MNRQELTVEEIVEAYADEISEWNYFSDHQVARMEDNHIQVCLRNYKWYITKEPIIDPMMAIKALFEIDWIAEYDDEDVEFYINYSKYWRKGSEKTESK